MIFIMINNKGYHLLKKFPGAPARLKTGKRKPAGRAAIKSLNTHKKSSIK